MLDIRKKTLQCMCSKPHTLQLVAVAVPLYRGLKISRLQKLTIAISWHVLARGTPQIGHVKKNLMDTHEIHDLGSEIFLYNMFKLAKSVFLALKVRTKRRVFRLQKENVF